VASELVYQYFIRSYEEENSRRIELVDLGKIYLSVITLYFGAIAFKLDVIVQYQKQLLRPGAFTLFTASATLFVLSYLLIFLAIGIKDYEAPSDLNEIIEAFGDEPPTNEQFADDRLPELAVATQRNATTNDQRALYLRAATASIALAGTAQIAGIGWLVYVA
jgi:hypothetical protein